MFEGVKDLFEENVVPGGHFFWNAGLLSQHWLTSRVGVRPPGLARGFESTAALSPGSSMASRPKWSFLLLRVILVLPVTPQLQVAKEAVVPPSPMGPRHQGVSDCGGQNGDSWFSNSDIRGEAMPTGWSC